jgi:hypothetical protein
MLSGPAIRQSVYVVVLCVLGVLCVGPAQLTLSAQFQMPDPRQMSGIPRPVDDLPAGTVSVRMIRGQLSNNLIGQAVEMQGGGKTLTVKTDDGGRAEFKGFAPGTTVKASADVDGEHLESQEFPFPAQGGIRLMLVATDKAAAAKPAVTGTVTLGGQSRIVVEPGDETLQVYYLLSIQNASSSPVNTPKPFAFDMPKEAVATSLLQGSSPQASVSGNHVLVQGPFAPGGTFVQVACEVPTSSGSFQISPRFPAQLEQLAVVVKKLGDTKLSSPAISRQQDLTEEGDTFIAATGGPVPPDQAIELTLSGLPHHSSVPQWTALSLAIVIIVAGAWVASKPSAAEPGRAAERQRLIARREKLLADLVRVENDYRNGRLDSTRYAGRREELIAALEPVYAALDGSFSLAPGMDETRRTRPPRPARDGAALGSSANA